jgi:hypothetical protein
MGKCQLFPLNKRRVGPHSRSILFGKQKSLLRNVQIALARNLAFCSAGTGFFPRGGEAACVWISPLISIWCRSEITVTACNNYWYFDFLLTYLLSPERLLYLAWLWRQQAFLKRPLTLTRPKGFTTRKTFLFHSVHCENRQQHNYTHVYIPTQYRGIQSLDPQSKTFPAFMKPEGSLRSLSHFRPKRNSFHGHQRISYWSILILLSHLNVQRPSVHFLSGFQTKH